MAEVESVIGVGKVDSFPQMKSGIFSSISSSLFSSALRDVSSSVWKLPSAVNPFPMGTSLSYPTGRVFGHVLEVENSSPPRHFNSYQLSHVNFQSRTLHVISPPTHAVLLPWA